jgi:hypothetical protein
MNSNKIVSATISAMPKSLFDPMPRVTATFEDGTEKFLFSYYPDELSFRPSEFVGLTYDQARNKKFVKDRAYLQS